MDAQRIVTGLRCQRAGCLCQKTAQQGHGRTHCPAHQDSNPSLNVTVEGERILLRCHTGCTQEAVLSALTSKGLWAQSGRMDWTPPRRSGKRTYYEVRDKDGTVIAVHVRTDSTAGKSFGWERPNGLRGLNGTAPADLLYGLELLASRPGDPIVLTEGEKAADALRRVGDILALATVTGAAGTPSQEVLKNLCGRRVYLWADNDENGNGQAHMERIAESLTELGTVPYIVNWQDAPDKGDAADFVATHTTDELRELLVSAQPWVPEPSQFDALVEPGPVWMANADLEVPVLVRGMLVAGGLGMVVSDPKSGKTWLAVELAICVGTGARVFGRYPVEKPGQVLYVATEGARAGAVARFKGLCLGHVMDPDEVAKHIDFIWRKGVRLDDPAFIRWLTAKAKRYVLIVVDVLVDAWDGEENKTEQAARLLRGLRPVTDARATLLLLHHLSKQMEGQSLWQRVRGSTAFRGAYDSGIGLERPEGSQRTKVSFEHRDDAPLKPFSFTWPEELVDGTKPVDLDWREQEEPKLDAFQLAQKKARETAAEHPGLTQEELALKIGGTAELNRKAIKALVDGGLLEVREARKPDRDGKVRRIRRELFTPPPTDVDDSDAGRRWSTPVGSGEEGTDVGGASTSPPVRGGEVPSDVRYPPEPNARRDDSTADDTCEHGNPVGLCLECQRARLQDFDKDENP
jgi:AAA domain